MAYLINSIPDMECQKLFDGRIPKLIDPTCGRYCLKSLLKYWHEQKQEGERVTRIALQKPKSFIRNWTGFDAYNDYPYADDILVKTRDKPESLEAWQALLMQVGPIIICGKGIGSASRFAGHYLLLLGIDPDNEKDSFYYLDPLEGNKIMKADISMQKRIGWPLIYAQSDIVAKLNDNSVQYFTVIK